MALFDKRTKQSLGGASSQPNISTRDIPSEVPVIGLKNTVIYPFTVVPVFFEDTTSLRALEYAQTHDNIIGAFAMNKPFDPSVKEESDDQKFPQLKPEDLNVVGTACVIHRVMPVSGKAGAMVVLQGLAKIEATHIRMEDDLLKAVVTVLDETVRDSKEVRALMKNALNTAQHIIQNTPYLPQELQIALEDLNDPLKFVYLLATLVRFDMAEKQMILEEDSVKEKLKKTAAILSRELEQIELGGKIVSNVKKEFNKMSREAFLRQQLKEIQRELGEESETQQEANEYRKKMDSGDFPDEVTKDVGREIERLESMHPHSSEYQVIRTYLDWVFDLPWGVAKSKAVDLKKVEATLNADHYGLEEVKKRLLEYLAVQKLSPKLKGPILCFVGPPGVGKTSLGKSIANALGREFVRISLGGVHDEAEIRGHRRTYVGAMPGKIIQGIRRAGVPNPVFMLDEIDKVGTDFRGDPSSALLEVLDPEQNGTFRDHYLDLNYDLSQVLFIATANILDTMQPALRDRMEVIDLSGYIDEEKQEIAKTHLWPRVLERHGLTKSKVKLQDSVFPVVINEYTREAGVRNLERELSKLARKVVFDMVHGKQKTATISPEKARGYLGSQRVFPEIKARTSRPGVATGMAVTQAGGEILFIETAQMPGGRGFMVTGSLGEIMKESARAALSVVRSRSEKLGIPDQFFKRNDIHVHVPQGAVPKDGPSAGVAMVTAIVSLILNKPVKHDVAMTGEITLTGQVLPVGGIKEKILAAKRAGISTVVLPKRNESDVKDIAPKLLKGLKVHFVESIDEVFSLVLSK
ncbi:endopeptidase La [candidate division WWE3 bacterium CG_4_10_14_0_2_um_filter_41_14]|uniref:Lon protease n=1 Tax=candidate division WWE3 bacterium CG_4_10_14_0_2_um_filter_41_14 TaxID=1975072 RepID=A0A2M7TFL7_UNCKA|nr:MAG: endopeptidase La [candidate division WWE3 bacterium CG_4_10_14_0_2_um_filter_41_14]